MSAIEDWEAYLNEQKLIVGMPGLRPRPSFLVGWAAGYIAGQSGKPIAGASTPPAASGPKLTDWHGGDIAAGTFILKDGRWAEVPRDTHGAIVLFHQVGWPQGEPK